MFTQDRDDRSRRDSSAEKIAWDPANLSQIIRYAESHPDGIAVFDADGTLWADDVGEAFFRWLIAERKLINVDYSRDIYQDYVDHVAVNKVEAYRWIAKALAGLSEKNSNHWAQEFFRDYFIPRIYACQQILIAELKKIGWDILIVSASSASLVKAGATYFGVDPSHVLAVELVVKEGVFTDEIIEPFTYDEGKVQAISQCLPGLPLLAFGDSPSDIPMLNMSTGLSIYITHESGQEDQAIQLARQSHWVEQYFPLFPPIQFCDEGKPVKDSRIGKNLY